MVELGWTMLEVMQEPPQNLMSQWYMTVAELATCHVSEDPCVPCSIGERHRGVHGVLRARIWGAITLICPLSAAVLWPGAASLDPHGDLTYGSLHNPVRGLHGD
jgi:hypothetical protein